jgi:acyl carrier protein phosphodiesterase
MIDNIMNWLAHILLSEPNVENRLGNLLGDLVKGKDLDGLNCNLRRGVIRHYAIDNQHLSGVENALDRIDDRIRARMGDRIKLVDAIPILERESIDLERDFHSFFPELQQHIQDWTISSVSSGNEN